MNLANLVSNVNTAKISDTGVIVAPGDFPRIVSTSSNQLLNKLDSAVGAVYDRAIYSRSIEECASYCCKLRDPNKKRAVVDRAYSRVRSRIIVTGHQAIVLQSGCAVRG